VVANKVPLPICSHKIGNKNREIPLAVARVLQYCDTCPTANAKVGRWSWLDLGEIQTYIPYQEQLRDMGLSSSYLFFPAHFFVTFRNLDVYVEPQVLVSGGYFPS
jgi:hypothetical protein